MSSPKPKSKSGRTPRCPICGKPRVAEYRPFCSARCRNVDLNRWFNQVYTIPAVEPDDEVGEDEPDEG